ncbi:MAG: reverse transcriptase domain-containing protein, partial [Rhabdochlamydiaceae bacterium]
TKQLRRNLQHKRFAVTIDLKAWFHQFPLDIAVRDFFVFRVDNDYYRYTRLPMGFSHAVDIAQETLELLWSTCAYNIFADLYIDNILIADVSKERVEEATQKFLRVLTTFGVTVGELTAATHFPVHRGVQFDLLGQRCALKKSFAEHIRYVPPRQPWYLFRKLICRIIYATSVLDFPRAFLFHTIKWATAHQFTHTNAKLTLPEFIVTEMQKASEILSTTSVPLTYARPQMTIITDASKTGYGYIVVNNETHSFSSHQGHWTVQQQAYHINVLELSAILLALQKVSSASIHIITDNTTAMWSIRSTYSPSPAITAVLTDIFSIAAKNNLHLTTSFVPTSMNPADPLSRNETPQWDYATSLFLSSLLLGWGGEEPMFS